MPWWRPTTSSSTGRSGARRSRTSGRLSTAGRSSPPVAPPATSARWAGGVAVAMTSGSTGRAKCVVQSEESLRYAGRSTIDAIGLEPGDAVGAFVPLSSVAAYCFGMYLPAMLGGPMVCIETWRPDDALAAMAAHDVRWTMLVPTMALQLSVRPTAQGRLTVPQGDDGGRRPHGRRRPGSGRAGPRHAVDPGLRHVRVPWPHDHPPRRGRRDEAGLRRPAVPRHRGARRGRGREAAPGGRGRRCPGARPQHVRRLRTRAVEPSRPGSPPTASSRPATWSASTPTGRSRSWAGRSRSSSAAAATSTSTRSRRPSPGSPPSRRSASCRCPTRCSVSGWPHSWCPRARR